MNTENPIEQPEAEDIPDGEVASILERIAANIDGWEAIEGPRLYVCPVCRDTGYEPGRTVRRRNHPYETFRPCHRCTLGARIEARILRDEAGA